MTDALRPKSHWFFGIRFLLVGAMNTVVGLCVIYACKWVFGLGDVPANALGYGVGIVVSFLLNRNWTFKDEGVVFYALLRFLCTFAVAYPLNLACVMYLVDHAGINSYLAQAMGIPPYTLTFYLASRYFVFRRVRQDD